MDKNISSEKLITSKLKSSLQAQSHCATGRNKSIPKNNVLELCKKDIEQIKKYLFFIENENLFIQGHFWETCTILSYTRWIAMFLVCFLLYFLRFSSLMSSLKIISITTLDIICWNEEVTNGCKF